VKFGASEKSNLTSLTFISDLKDKKRARIEQIIMLLAINRHPNPIFLAIITY